MNVSVEPRWEFRVIFDAYTDDMAMAALTGLSEGAVRANMVWFNVVGGEAPCCLSSAGVRYIRPKGCGLEHPCQTVIGAAEILEVKEATCIDICCYIAAQLRLRGFPARVVFTNMLDSNGKKMAGMYHALVETSDGIIDYTQDLIDGNNERCSMDCQTNFQSVPPAQFDPAAVLPG